MSLLVTWPDEEPGSPLLETSDPAEIAVALRNVGCGFERREIRPGLSPQAPEDEVLAAYRDLGDAEAAARGFRQGDVAGIAASEDPGYPAQAARGPPTLIHEHPHWAGDERRVLTR